MAHSQYFMNYNVLKLEVTVYCAVCLANRDALLKYNPANGQI